MPGSRRTRLLAPLALRAAAPAAAAEWQTLFDGRSTTAFLSVNGGPFPGDWEVRDGCLCAVPAQAGRRDLRTAGEVEHWLNGQLVAVCQTRARARPLSPQHHNTGVCFGAMRIRALKQAPPQGR